MIKRGLDEGGYSTVLILTRHVGASFCMVDEGGLGEGGYSGTLLVLTRYSSDSVRVIEEGTVVEGLTLLSSDAPASMCASSTLMRTFLPMEVNPFHLLFPAQMGGRKGEEERQWDCLHV